jgi:hypothetical protein
MSTDSTPARSSLEGALEQLYAAAPERFTELRDALAKELRATDKEVAATVKALRRPPVTAWALNQVARSHPDELAALIDADAALARAQREGEGPEALAETGRARRELIARLVAAAASVLVAAGHPDSPATRDRMARTLAAVAVDEEGREALRRGRLTGDLTPESLWESAAPAGSADPAAVTAFEDHRERQRRADEATAEARRLQQEADLLEAEAGRADRAAQAARTLAAEARRKATAAAERAEETTRDLAE